MPEAPATNVIKEHTHEKPLKIALLGYRSHPFVGGQGIYIKYLARALKKMGHCVHVYSGQPYPELDDDIELIKIPSLNLYESDNHVRALRWHHLRSFTDTYEWWTMLTGGFGEPYTFGRRIVKQLKHSNYDVIHDNQSLSFGLLKLQRLGHTVISTIHHPIHRDRELALKNTSNWGMRLLVKRWHSFLTMQEKVVRKLQHVITVSRQSQHDIATYFQRSKETTPVIMNGIDSHAFRPLPHIHPKTYSLLTTSSSDQPLKGLHILLQALAKLRIDYPRISLRVIGKLQDNGRNDQHIKELGLDQHITFINGLSTEQLVEEYNRASIVVCPSLYEGFGLPIAEAMACGRPVIATDGGALPEVVGNAGIIVKAGDINAMSQAIRTLIEQPKQHEHFGQQARLRITEHFCWQGVAKELTAFYRQCMRQQMKNQ